MYESPSTTFMDWPEWLEAARIDDALAAEAYESTPAPLRAAIKTGLALSHMHFGQSPGQTKVERRDGHLGFWQQEVCEPASWALFVFPPSYRAAARLAAACMPALLAGVPLLGAVCLGGRPSSEALVCLELCGVENLYSLDMMGLERLLRSSPTDGGRLVLLHEGELAPVAALARATGLSCYEEWRAPCLVLRDATAFDLESLSFAQGGGIVEQADIQSGRPIDALYSISSEADRPASLLLTPGCEGFWLHPGLDPGFFTQIRRAFGAILSPR